MTGLPGSIAVVVAAHGADSGNESVERVAEALRLRRPDLGVSTGYHRGRPGFAEAIESVTAAHVVVVPLFTSDGYYVRTVLSGEVPRGRGTNRVTITPPIGIHPGVAPMVAAMLHVRYAGPLAEPGSEVVVVGHGTEKNATSGDSTVALAAALLRLGAVRRSTAAFLDQEPRLEWLADPGGPRIVFPFLIGGAHLDRDLPARLGIRGGSNPGGLVVTEPFGSLPGVVDLVESSLLGALRWAA